MSTFLCKTLKQPLEHHLITVVPLWSLAWVPKTVFICRVLGYTPESTSLSLRDFVRGCCCRTRISKALNKVGHKYPVLRIPSYDFSCIAFLFAVLMFGFSDHYSWFVPDLRKRSRNNNHWVGGYTCKFLFRASRTLYSWIAKSLWIVVPKPVFHCVLLNRNRSKIIMNQLSNYTDYRLATC